MEWLADHTIEIFGAVSGIIYVILEIRQNRWLWPLGIVTSAVYLWVFYHSKFYADMGLQGYYLLISLYGWWYWSGSGRRGSKGGGVVNVTVTRAGGSLAIILLAAIIVLTLVLWILLSGYTDSPLPGWDAFTTAVSVVATWMLARKIIEHWYLWIVADIVSAALYIYRGLYPTVVLFIVYTVMAFVGLREWRRDLIMTEKN